MTEKKISFGFKLVKKQPVLLPTKIDIDKKNDIELIQCLEGQTIKLIHEKVDEKPLVIPCLNSSRTSAALASLQNLKNVLDGDEPNDEANSKGKADTKPVESTETKEPMTIEERVVKELLNEAKNADEENDDTISTKLTLPLAADKLPLDGAKQSSMDDYDNIPINQFGLAMLRGMGLKDEEIISKQNKELELRPKGMGLGADKVVKKLKLLVAPSVNETLEIKKNAYVRILAGKHKDLYGQIEGLDDHACRVIVKLAVGGAKEAFNEFMVQPVSKKEFQEYGKVINSAKYDEYKRKQDKKEAERDVKKEMKTEKEKEKEKIRYSSRERDRNNSTRSQRESSPRQSKEQTDYGSSSRQTERKDRSHERSKRSPSFDRNRYKDVERDSNRWSEARRSRSLDKYQKSSTVSRRDRSRDRSNERNDKHRRPHDSSSDQSPSDSDNSDNKRSHHKKSKKKNKKKSSKKNDSSDDGDRHHKKKTKKNKRERSRSRSRGRR